MKYERLTVKGAKLDKKDFSGVNYSGYVSYELDEEALDLVIKAVNRLAELEDKIVNGTLIELPCKVGDTVWYIKSYGFGRYRVEDMEVAGFNFSKYENSIWVVGKYEEQSSKIYKTREEAEAKLKEIQK